MMADGLLVSFRGHCPFQSVPSKPGKYRISLGLLCVSFIKISNKLVFHSFVSYS